MPSTIARHTLPVAATLLATHAALAQPLPPVPVPPQNPITEEKRVLGKILFWDEQLSTDNTMACGTCHVPTSGGTDPIRAQNPGPDGTLNTPDDVFGSFGVIAADANEDYAPDVVFDLTTQITGRAANTNILAMHAPDLFWDGRATSTFTDPQTGNVSIPAGGALESQAVGPIVSSVEMAHADRDWDHITLKLDSAVPLALATNTPIDAADAINTHKDYPTLFESAFGDNAITAERIAYAIATYQRTLVPDQTPWDQFIAGNPAAMTQGQTAGWNFFRNSACAICHQPPLFTDSSFRNIRVRPSNEDLGRQDITGNPADRGRFKVPTLRNTGLKSSFMHTGGLTAFPQVLALYGNPNPGDNRDPILPVPVPPQVRPALQDFILNALTDPRVQAEIFPFDRPTLFSEQPDNPRLIAGGTAGTNGFVPRMIAVVPPNVGNTGFKVGLDNALAGTGATLRISSNPPIAGVVSPDETEGPFLTGGIIAGEGFATCKLPIEADASLDGTTLYMQWQIDDPAATGGTAFSAVAQVDIFCNGNCPVTTCPCELTGDEPGNPDYVTVVDLLTYLNDWFAKAPPADWDQNGTIDAVDLLAYLACWFAAPNGDCG